MVALAQLLRLSLLGLVLMHITLNGGAHARCLFFQSTVVVRFGKQAMSMTAASFFRLLAKMLSNL